MGNIDLCPSSNFDRTAHLACFWKRASSGAGKLGLPAADSRFARQGPSAPKGCPKNNVAFFGQLPATISRKRCAKSPHWPLFAQQLNRINRFRDIDVGSWPKKSTLFYHPLFILFHQKNVWMSDKSWEPEHSLTVLSQTLSHSLVHSLSTCWTTFVFMSMLESHCL